jgi:hypothetical protein
MTKKMILTVLILSFVTYTNFVKAQTYKVDSKYPGIIYVYPRLLDNNTFDSITRVNIDNTLYCFNVFSIDKSIFKKNLNSKTDLLIKKWDKNIIKQLAKYEKTIIYTGNSIDNSLLIAE